jgi:transposase-like protein
MESTTQLDNVNMDFIESKEQIIGKRKRKKSNYRKINNETRQKLIEMVYLQDYLLKDASRILGVNYSTAKTILRIFRIEKRVEKKKADEERELKNVIFNFKQERRESENESLSLTAIGTANNHHFSDEENKYHCNREPTFKLLSDSSKSLTNFKIQINDSPQHLNEQMGINQNQNYLFQNMNQHMENFTQQFRKLTHIVESCFKNIKSNQIMINSLVQSSMMIKSDPKNAQNMQNMMKMMNCQNPANNYQNNGNSYLNYNTNSQNSELLQNPAFLNFLKKREQDKQIGKFNN